MNKGQFQNSFIESLIHCSHRSEVPTSSHRSGRRENENSFSTKSITVLHLRTSAGSGGGPEKTIINTGRLLEDQNANYIVGYMRQNQQELSRVARTAADAGLPYIEFPGKSVLDLRQLGQILRVIKKYRVDILHSHDPKSDCYAIMLRLLNPGLKLVTTLHGWIKQPRLKSSLYLILDKFVLRFFHIVLAVSRPIEEEARCHGANTILLHNAIDTDLWKPRAPSSQSKTQHADAEHLKVGFVGRLSPEKGAMDFLRVARRILEQNIAMEFLIAGQGPEQTAMEDYIKRFGINNHIRFLGQLSGSEMIDFYEQLDCLLSPSLTEGLPNNLLEACAMEIPVVATIVGGVGELITHDQNGLLCQAGDIVQLVKNVVKIKQNPIWADELGRNGRETVKSRFSFQTRTKRLLTIYRDLVA